MVSYADTWKPLNIEFKDEKGNISTEMPDLSTSMGKFFLNNRACDALQRATVRLWGVFACELNGGGTGYIFTPLKIAEGMEALNEKLTGYDSYGNLANFSFDESKINKTPVFKAEIDGCQGGCRTSELIMVIEKTI